MIYRRIQYFLEAARLGSFSKAAEKMYISPQALTKQVGYLEEELGGKLLERSSRGVQLTRLGEYASLRLGKLDEELNAVMEELKTRARDEKERINIGIFAALPQENMVTPVITFLLGRFSNYQIGLNLIDMEEGRKLLFENKIDLLLTNTHEEDEWKGYRCLSFGAKEAKVVVSLLHPWAIKERISLEDMRQQDFLKMRVEKKYTRCQKKKASMKIFLAGQ